MFCTCSDKNFNGVGPILSRKAREISSQFDERHGDKSVREMKQFVAKLPHMLATKQSLAKRTYSGINIITLIFSTKITINFFFQRYDNSRNDKRGDRQQ